jgi:hypothetical protein
MPTSLRRYVAVGVAIASIAASPVAGAQPSDRDNVGPNVPDRPGSRTAAADARTAPGRVSPASGPAATPDRASRQLDTDSNMADASRAVSERRTDGVSSAREAADDSLSGISVVSDRANATRDEARVVVHIPARVNASAPGADRSTTQSVRTGGSVPARVSANGHVRPRKQLPGGSAVAPSAASPASRASATATRRGQ